MAKQGASGAIALEAGRLHSLAEELAAIARALEPGKPPAPPDPGDLGDYTRLSAADQQDLVTLARRFYRSRRLRPRVFSDEALFGEPAWDMLLDLFIAEADGKRLSVTAACIGSAVPTSTALRWLVILEDRGLVRRENDPSDARRVFLQLTSDGYAKMANYFLQLQREGVFGA